MCSLLLACFPPGACQTAVNAPDPILLLDFEDSPPGSVLIGKSSGLPTKPSFAQGGRPPKLAAGKGIAGSDCLDLTRNGSGQEQSPVLVLDTPELLELLGEAWSFTVTGWIRRNVDFADEDTTNQCILHCPGRFRIVSHGTYRWRLGLEIVGAASQEPRWVWSTWLVNFYPDDRWVFFAVSYDGTKSDKSYVIYYGHEQYPVKEDASGPLHAGQLSSKPAGGLIIGASTPDGRGRLKGMIDNIRIYATKEKSSACALDWRQLDRVRRADLGPEWIEKVTSERANRRQAETENLRRIEDTHWSKTLNLHQVDSLERIFSDRPSVPVENEEPRSVPRGGQAALQFAAMTRDKSARPFNLEVSPIKNADGTPLAGKVKLYELIDVPVEANNNGGSRTSVTKKPPPIWMEHFVREAPFRVAEVLVESNTVSLGGDPLLYQGILVTVDVAPDAKPGIYQGALELKSGDASVSTPFSIEVHKTVAPKDPILSSVHWLFPEPENLTNEQPPEWWSERHWRLLENSGGVLRDFGQDTLLTPLINYEDPLIQTIREEDGSYSFDFSRFDRWMETFIKQGYKRFSGHHIIQLPRGRGITVVDRKTKRKEVLFTGSGYEEAWLEFLPTFYKGLHRHLDEKRWVRYYTQHLYDEPRDFEKYKRLSEMLREYMPGVRSIDAVKTKPEYSPFVDIHVFDIFLIYPNAQRLAAERKSRGQDVWLYHCCSPYPPYPNRHLDERLSHSRLYPWLCYLLNADGYLYWGANVYRGADPYKTSIGPVPGGSQNPGHPPGDNWMFYPGPDGLRGSMRMVAFREGLLDHTLLSMLAAKDRARADEIMSQIARDTLDYAKEPKAFHAARKALLRELDALD